MLNNKSLVLLLFSALMAVTCSGNIYNLDINTRIANGKSAARGQFPYYALVKIFLSDGSNTTCGGTLINNQWILTAASCVIRSGVTVDKFEVHLGALNATDLIEEGRVVVSTKQSFLHPKYTRSGIQNDVALLKLEEPVQFSDHVQAIKLTQNATLDAGTNVTTIGFGKLRTSKISSTLQFAELVLITRQQCAHYFPLILRRKDVICAIGENRESPCNGDTGGPLVQYENGVPVLVGSTSFGHFAGCYYGYPTGFANASAFLSWIQQTIVNQ